jgi:hypothetical protein
MSQIFYFILYDIDPTLYTILIKAITYLHPFTIPQSTTGTELRKKNEDSSALFLVSSGIRRITNACNLETKIGQISLSLLLPYVVVMLFLISCRITGDILKRDLIKDK